jgi:hypothetical protein
MATPAAGTPCGCLLGQLETRCGCGLGVATMPDEGKKQGKQFFFEKNHQKTLAYLHSITSLGCIAGANLQRFFGSSFQKRTTFFLAHKHQYANITLSSPE